MTKKDIANSKPVEKIISIKAPKDLKNALSNNEQANAAWSSITSIAKRDFITWIESAKQPETRMRRITIACDKLASGKRRPCCYAVVPMNLYKALDKNTKAKSVWKELTGMQRRDFTDWIDETNDKEIAKLRIEQACQALASNKRHI